MKVLSITNFNIGHAATLPEISLFKGLHEKGVELTVVISFPTIKSEELESYGIKLVYIPFKRKIDFLAIRLLRALIIENEFDIIHLTYSKAISNCLLAARGTNSKLVAYIGSTSVHWHDPMAYLSFLNPRISRIICLSNGVQEHFLKQAPRRLKGKTVRIYKGYDPEWFSKVIPADRNELKIPENGIVICCIANVRKIKGIEYLIKAAELLPDKLPVYFLLIGNGMDTGIISRRIKESKFRENFRVRGYTNEVLLYTATCDIYVQPSISEGLGKSVIEAMCLGKPVIVSGTGGVGELINEGVNGFHIPSRSPEAIAEKIIYFCKNPDKIKTMGAKSRERIESDFNSDKMVEETYQLFRSMVSLQ